MEKSLSIAIANLAKYWQENKPTNSTISPLVNKRVKQLDTLFNAVGTINVPSTDNITSLLKEREYNAIRELYMEYTMDLEEWACTIRLNFSELSRIMEFLCSGSIDTNRFDEIMNNVVIEIEKIIPELDGYIEKYKKAYFNMRDFGIYKKIESHIIIKDEDDW